MKLSWPLEPSYVGSASFCSSGGEKPLMGQTPYCAQGSGSAPHPQEESGCTLGWPFCLQSSQLCLLLFSQCWSGHCGLAPAPPLSHMHSQSLWSKSFLTKFLSFVCPEVLFLCFVFLLLWGFGLVFIHSFWSLLSFPQEILLFCNNNKVGRPRVVIKKNLWELL